MEKVIAIGNTVFEKLMIVRDLPLLLLRLTVGYVFFMTGKGKLSSLPDVIEFFRGLGIPAPEIQAPFVAGLECVGGLMVLLGLGTRIISIPLAFTMVVAIATAKWADLESLQDFLSLNEWLYLLIFVAFVFLGPGRASMDHLLSRTVFKKADEDPS